MASERRIAANQANAAKSTGPRTETGKAAARMNALKHGLTAAAVVLPTESATEFEAFRAAMVDRLAPADEIEAVLVERIVLTAWRLKRTAVAEVDLLKQEMRLDTQTHRFSAMLEVIRSGEVPKVEPSAGMAFGGLLDGEDKLSKLSRYETTLERGLFRAMHELERLQAKRVGEPVLPPITVDVDVNGGFVSQNRPTADELPEL